MVSKRNLFSRCPFSGSLLNFRGYNLKKSKDPTGIYLFLVKLLSELLGRYANLRERKPLFSSNPKKAAVQTCMLNQTRQQDNTIQYNLIQLYTVPLYTIQHSIQYNSITIQYNSIQYDTIQYNSIQFNTLLYKHTPRTGLTSFLEGCPSCLWVKSLETWVISCPGPAQKEPQQSSLLQYDTLKHGHINNKNSNNNLHIDLSQLAILKCSITTIYSS